MKYLYNAFLWLCGVVLAVMVLQERDISCYPSHISHTDSGPINTTDIPENTLASIHQNLAQREYHITFDQNKQTLQSPNRRHNLRAYYKPGNLTIQNRIDSAGHNFRLELVNQGIYADGAKLFQVQANAPTDNRADTLHISHQGFTEEFINNEAGIRQNFIIDRAPVGTRKLQVRLLAKGLQVRQSGQDAVAFYAAKKDGSTDAKLTYNDLKCWDSEGKPLAASMALSGKQIEINVDVADAAYPVTIDPIIANGNPANADKTLEINQSYSWLGFSVSTAGDVNGDGYSDVLVGAPKYDNGQADEGAAFLYPGTAGGISLAATALECNQANAQMGYSVSNAGDINKDGFSDVLVGAPYYDGSASNEGVVMIYKGSANGLVTNSPYIFKLDQADANLGTSVAMAGDVNGDGYSDMLAGAHQFDNNQSNEGVGVLILGAPNGLGLVTFLECNQPNAMMGFAVAGAGDVDGDGFSDVMAGARLYSNGQALEGAVFIFKGSANGVVTANPTIIEGNQVDARLGHALSSAGDVNGDGFSDVALGAYLYDKGSNNEGVVMIHYGSANGVSIAPSQTLESDQVEAQFGVSVACAGDVNGDGYADLIAGARYYDKGHVNEGTAFIYQGSKDGLNPIPVSVLESNQGDGWLGSAVAPAGDVNGDGFSDVMVGSYAFDNGQKDEGSVFVWLGSGSRLNEVSQPTVISQLKSSSYEGNAVANAGDINGDGYSDIIVGAIRYHENNDKGVGAAIVYYGSANGINTGNFDIIKQEQWWPYPQFSCSVSAAGDVNGDGFDDIVIGAYAYQTGGTDAGAAFVYYGSANGVVANAPTTLFDVNVGSEFGRSVSAASDINNDGYDDVMVGAPLYKINQLDYGAVYLYFGSASGIQSVPQIIEGSYVNAQFGCSVSSAGDTNGDGFKDLIIGAKLFSDGENNQGAVFIYKGSASGVASNEVVLIQENKVNSKFGSSVSTAGDVNGDGFGDIVVGAPNYGNLSIGAAFIYYGSPVGLDIFTPAIIEGDIPGAAFGISVKSSGDVNADGYSDVIIGAQDYKFGAAFVFYGASTGINTSTHWYFVSDWNTNYGELMGASVSGSGDVNADGFSDIVIGSVFYQWSGGSLTFSSNSNTGIRNNLRLYNADLTTSINHNQFALGNFGTGLFAKSFQGRNKGKLVWETKPSNQGFSKGSNNRITNSTQSTGSQNAYSNLGTTGLELKSVIDKQGSGTKVRMRVRYDPVLALTGQSYGPWRYLPAYLMGNSTAPVPVDSVGNTVESSELQVTSPLMDSEKAAVIYPNPASGQLHIRVSDPESIRKVQLLTLSGEIVYQSGKLAKSLDLTRFTPGIYILQLSGVDGSQTRRITISH